MTALVDTNILVYSVDPRFPPKRQRAVEILRNGIDEGSLHVPYQALVEFVAAVTRQLQGGGSILTLSEAREHAEGLLAVLPVLYPDETTLRNSLRIYEAYQLLGCAEANGLDEILSEDFQHQRTYGTVWTVNPFIDIDSA